MIGIEQAIENILAKVHPLPAIELGLGDALFYTLAEPVVSDIDFPPFDRSVMDGYAVRAADVLAASAKLRIVGQVPAGVQSTSMMASGEAMQINTGASIPEGADAVVRVEQTELVDEGQDVVIQKAVQAGSFITPRGALGRAGQVVLDVGSLLTPINVAAAATAGAAKVSVYRKPSVALISTGSELVSVETKPGGAQIRNSNEPLLVALLAEQHMVSTSLGSCLDDPQRIRAAVEAGADFDAICMTGGISMGAFDFVPQVLEACGATFLVHKVAIKPGRPTIVAQMPSGQLVFALPGNPLSAFVTFHLMVKPALAVMAGRTDSVGVPIRCKLSGMLNPTRDRQTYIPARVQVDESGDYVAHMLRWRGSGDSLGAVGANALIVQQTETPAVVDGEQVSVLIVGGI